MPELPEVETVRRGLAPVMEGAVIDKVEQRRPDLRKPFPAALRPADHRTPRHPSRRRAKYLLADLDDGTVLVMHLGMSGSFRVEADGASRTVASSYRPRSKLCAHDHVVFDLSSGVRVDLQRSAPLRPHGSRRARGHSDARRHFQAIGIEPLGNELERRGARQLFAGRKAPLKACPDGSAARRRARQHLCLRGAVAGSAVARPAGGLAGERDGKAARSAPTRLVEAIRSVLEAAIAAGGSSLRDHVRTDGELGDFQHDFAGL